MIQALILTTLAILALAKILTVYSDKIKFFTLGNDNGFKFSESSLLWKLAKVADIDDPVALFLSVPTLNKAIANYISDARRRGVLDSEKVQDFLAKLYSFRTKLNIEHENKKGLESTKYMDKGQRLRIILKGHGVFASTIVNNGYEMVITLPVQNHAFPVPSENWVGKTISVYLWRKGDASYVFDTTVTNAGVFNGKTVLYLAQTSELLRTQKRRSVRCECHIPASMYFIKNEITDFNVVEAEPGFKVILEDISEDGAMIRVGGKGIVNAQIKLQFTLNDILILMYGVVRAVEYNKEINQSRLHFECVHLDKDMRNTVLSFVYNVLPQEQKDVFDAINATEEDKAEDEVNSESGSEVLMPEDDGSDKTEQDIALPNEQKTDDKSDDGEKASDIESFNSPESSEREKKVKLSGDSIDELARIDVS